MTQSTQILDDKIDDSAGSRPVVHAFHHFILSLRQWLFPPQLFFESHDTVVFFSPIADYHIGYLFQISAQLRIFWLLFILLTDDSLGGGTVVLFCWEVCLDLFKSPKWCANTVLFLAVLLSVITVDSNCLSSGFHRNREGESGRPQHQCASFLQNGAAPKPGSCTWQRQLTSISGSFYSELVFCLCFNLFLEFFHTQDKE